MQQISGVRPPPSPTILAFLLLLDLLTSSCQFVSSAAGTFAFARLHAARARARGAPDGAPVLPTVLPGRKAVVLAMLQRRERKKRKPTLWLLML